MNLKKISLKCEHSRFWNPLTYPLQILLSLLASLDGPVYFTFSVEAQPGYHIPKVWALFGKFVYLEAEYYLIICDQFWILKNVGNKLLDLINKQKIFQQLMSYAPKKETKKEPIWMISGYFWKSIIWKYVNVFLSVVLSPGKAHFFFRSLIQGLLKLSFLLLIHMIHRFYYTLCLILMCRWIFVRLGITVIYLNGLKSYISQKWEMSDRKLHFSTPPIGHSCSICHFHAYCLFMKLLCPTNHGSQAPHPRHSGNVWTQGVVQIPGDTLIGISNAEHTEWRNFVLIKLCYTT